MKFAEFSLHPGLQRGIADLGFTDCMPVQEQVLSHALGGQDLYVQSQTGTGKTAAFLVVIFQRLLTEETLAGKKALIMAPTRELAVQIEEEAKALGKYLKLKTGSFYGGVGYEKQEKLLRDNCQIMVGTPGRVLDLNKSGYMPLMDIAFLVLDEADRMFDMGFYPDLRKLISVIPPAEKRQTMLFSATLNAWVKNLAWEYTKNPFEIEIKGEAVTADDVEQLLYHVPSQDKMRLLLGILARENPQSLVVFCNTKRYAEIVAKRLRANGRKCEFIVGDLPQSKRLSIIDDVKSGKVKTLVATDVAARGLDIAALEMVINYDLPSEAENYVHRIGRTARAGNKGKAISLVSEQDVYNLPAVERYLGEKIPFSTATDDLYENDKSEGHRMRSEVRSTASAQSRPQKSFDNKNKRSNKGSGDKAAKNFSSSRKREKPYGNSKKEAVKNSQQRQIDSKSAEDLQAMSFEERMALYKKKYSKGDSKISGEKVKNLAAEAKSENLAKKKKNLAPAPSEKAKNTGIFAKFIGIFKKK